MQDKQALCTKTWFVSYYQLIDFEKQLMKLTDDYKLMLDPIGKMSRVTLDKGFVVPYQCHWKLTTFDGSSLLLDVQTSRFIELDMSKKLARLSVTYDDREQDNMLVQVIEDQLITAVPERFINMQQFLCCLDDWNQVDITQLNLLTLPAAVRSIQELFQEWNQIDTVKWIISDNRHLDKGSRTHRIEVKENCFQYVETNKYCIFEKDGILVAAGISSSESHFGNVEFKLICYTESRHMDMIQHLFDHSFYTLLEKQMDFTGGKYNGRHQIIRLTEKFSIDDLIVDDPLKQSLHREIFGFFDMAEYYRSAGLSFKRGIILHGPPGTGKTTIAKIIVSQMPQTVIWVKPEDCEDRGSLGHVFRLARMAKPAVLIFEDADFIALDRRMSRSGITGDLLNELDGLANNEGILVIMTTNQLDVVEKAISDRPGRIDAKIYIGELTRERIAELLNRKLNSFNRNFAEFSCLIPASLKLTGAEVVEMAQLIMREALQEMRNNQPIITEQHVWQALKQISHNKERKNAVGFN